MSAQTEVTVMNMISQGQIAASQRKLFEAFVAGVAVAALAIALVWGAVAIASTPKSVAPSATTIQYLQEPGLLEQRAGERGGAVPSTTKYLQEPGLLEQRAGERGGAVAIPSTKTTVSGDSLLEQRRRERSIGSQPVPKQQHGNGLVHGPLR
jgi:hypothetical protein